MIPIGFDDEDLNRAPDEDDEEPVDGFFDDDGNRLNPDLVPKPGLCLLCKHENEPSEEVLCTLNRLDQAGAQEFECGAFEPKTKK
jgi:hypothetical protein